MKIGFLASHGGSSARHLISAIRNGDLNARVGPVVANNRSAEIVAWCRAHDVDVHHISGNTHADEAARDAAICDVFERAATELIVLSGYMKKIGPLVLARYENKILNIHPSLLPKFGGQGMYGDHVHKAVLEAGESVSGASVQFINGEYDDGPVLAQQQVLIEAGETLDSLRAKVQAIEGELYLRVVGQLIAGRSA